MGVKNVYAQYFILHYSYMELERVDVDGKFPEVKELHYSYMELEQ